jgi:hypothetical protein
MPQYKAKVITAEYLEPKDLLVFTMRDLVTGKEQSYCWPPSDYFSAIGISSSATYTPGQLHSHCEQMLGKELNFSVDGELPSQPVAIDPKKAEQIDKDCHDLAQQANEKIDKELAAAKEISKMRFGAAG